MAVISFQHAALSEYIYRGLVETCTNRHQKQRIWKTLNYKFSKVLMTNEMHYFYNQFLFHSFFVCSTCFEWLDSFETCRAEKKLE